MGGYLFTTGLLTVYIALTALRARATGAMDIVAVAGLASIGWMVVVNFGSCGLPGETVRKSRVFAPLWGDFTQKPT